MPLKANVGLSRKVADNNYGSRGASINIELELDSSLIGEPVKFQEKIRQVYGLARSALNEELNGGNGHAAGTANASPNGANANNEATSATGNGVQQSNGQRPRPATQSQVKALHAIARNQRLDLTQYLSGSAWFGSSWTTTIRHMRLPTNIGSAMGIRKCRSCLHWSWPRAGKD